MIEVGVTHIVLAGGSPRWLAEEIIEPVLAQVGQR